MKAFLVGANYTSPHDFEILKNFIRHGSIDYVEILIDNFLSVDPMSIVEEFDGFPIAIHIMSSQFINATRSDLCILANPIRRIIEATKPIYVSDHVAQFSYRNRSLPIPIEYDYDLVGNAIRAVNMWQELLGTSLLLENFPSHDTAGTAQAAFFDALTSATGAGMLFDVSNAIVAQKNMGLSITEWDPLLCRTKHFHMGGYSVTSEQPSIFIDSHDRKLSDDTRAAAQALFRTKINDPGCTTLTVEFDHNIDQYDWEQDLRWAKRLSRERSLYELC